MNSDDLLDETMRRILLRPMRGNDHETRVSIGSYMFRICQRPRGQTVYASDLRYEGREFVTLTPSLRIFFSKFSKFGHICSPQNIVIFTNLNARLAPYYAESKFALEQYE